jgi:uncharacterized protein with HEPN domain
LKRTYRHFVWDILENVRDSIAFTTEVSAEVFFKDRMRQKAVERCITVIGEAAKRIPKELQTRFSEVPWSDMARTRDKIIHHYEGVDVIIMYKIVTQSLPLIEEPLQKMFDTLTAEEIEAT